MTLLIRPLAGPAEAEACARLMAASEPWITLGRGFEASLRVLTDAARERYVAFDGERLAGFLILNLQGAFVGYVQTVCVASEMRGRGAGTALVAFAEERIFREHPNVFLCVSSFNPGARRLYERLGYTFVGELADYLVAGHAELLFRKSRGPIVGYGPPRRLRLLALAGSLRRASVNTALLRACAHLAPAGVEVVLYEGLGTLPLFNPDLEAGEPAAVTDFRVHVRGADGLLISSPEYAHGVPGLLKNALDWLVGGFEFIGKPVALLNATPPATWAQASLAETVTVMSGRLVQEASLDVPLRGRKIDEAGIVADPALAEPVRTALEAFTRAIEGSGSPPPPGSGSPPRG